MDKRRRKQSKSQQVSLGEDVDVEVSSKEWELVNLSEAEEDLVYRMHKLVGDRWGLIAGRIPGRKPEEIERFWLMRHDDAFADLRRKYSRNTTKSPK